MAKVQFKRIEDSADINSVPGIDGQIIYTKDGKTYLDYEGQRVVVNGTPDITMSDSSTNAIANSTVKSYIDTNIATVNSNIHNGTILWTNPNPASDFTAQNITLSSSDYDVLEFHFLMFSSTNIEGSIKARKGNSVRFLTYASIGGTSIRTVNYVDDTTYAVDNESDNNNRGVPIYIIGYKTGLFN